MATTRKTPDPILVNPKVSCYFDHNATTPVAPEVLESMIPFLRDSWANPSSAYTSARDVARQLDRGRSSVADLVGAEPREILFTSCGTESINAAMHSALSTQPSKEHVVTTTVEHSATMRVCEVLKQRGCDVTFLPVDSDGGLDLRLLERSIRPDTALVSVMWANNETGVLFPIAEIASMCRAHGVLFHTDAVQAVGKVPVSLAGMPVDFLSSSGHKIYAPKGIGILYVRRGTKFAPFVVGGNQEHGRRGGTENVANIVAFGRAAELAKDRLGGESPRVQALRDRLEKKVLASIPGAIRNGAAEPRLPNTTNISFEGVEADQVLLLLDQVGVCASSGAACSFGSIDPSHVLIAMGADVARARASIRFSLGKDNTDGDVDYVLQHLPGIIQKLRRSTQG